MRGDPREQRRLVLARLPGPQDEATVRVAEALRTVAVEEDVPAM
ncbi:hypothetical protein [Streptomyces asiaticus]